MNDAHQFGELVERKRLTEAEVRIAGHASQRLLTLRTMLADIAKGGTLQTRAGTLQLNSTDTQAVLALLIERDEQFLIQLDIQLAR